MKPVWSRYGFEAVKRHDGSVAIYDYCWWPDDLLDTIPERNEEWLMRTGGWRAKGWIIVTVVQSFKEALDWTIKHQRGY